MGGYQGSLIADRFGNRYWTWLGIYGGPSVGVGFGNSEGFANQENNYAIVDEENLRDNYISGSAVFYGGTIAGMGIYRYHSLFGPQESTLISLSANLVAVNYGITFTATFTKNSSSSWNWIFSTQQALGNGPEDLLNGTYKKLPYQLP